MTVKKLNNYKELINLYEIFVKIHLLLHNIELQPKVETILTYFVKYGISDATDQLILKNNVVPKIQSISNARTILFDKGLLLKKPWRLVKELSEVNIDSVLDFHIRCKKIEG